MAYSPGYKGDVPEGYFVVKSPTYTVNYFLRGFQADGKTDQAVALMKKIKVPRENSQTPAAARACGVCRPSIPC